MLFEEEQATQDLTASLGAHAPFTFFVPLVQELARGATRKLVGWAQH